MKCKNCGTENPDDVECCKKCGKGVNENKYRICWIPVGIGAAFGVILLFILRALMGDGNLLLATFIPWVMLSGAIATVLSYDKNVRAGYDFNPLISGIIAGTIAGLLILAGTPVDDSGISVLGFSSIIGCIFWAFAGTIIGIIINLIREKDKRLFMPTIIVIAAVLLSMGYISNSMTTNWDFETAFSNQIMILEFDNLLQAEADSFIKNSTNSNANNSDLKKAQGNYQKMIEITTNAVLWNKKLLKSSTSDTQKEYSAELGKYIELNLQYYKTKKQAIDFQIQGKTIQAQIKYKEAQKILPQIKAQEKIINNTLEKDPELQKRVKAKIESDKRYVKRYKEELITDSFETPEILNQK
ncbi:MAG: zinc ribbon domain-containing protein [Methanobacteriaceae archaeon]|nr:zinc ribbon domain-containing protein [Methanobacteriaceae archaeon]MDP3623014.1 zinc ribbon domain-containing protein [Methanobacteriaceae archaeon]